MADMLFCTIKIQPVSINPKCRNIEPNKIINNESQRDNSVQIHKKTLDEFNKHTVVLIFSYKNVILTVNTEEYICPQLN